MTKKKIVYSLTLVLIIVIFALYYKNNTFNSMVKDGVNVIHNATSEISDVIDETVTDMLGPTKTINEDGDPDNGMSDNTQTSTAVKGDNIGISNAKVGRDLNLDNSKDSTATIDNSNVTKKSGLELVEVERIVKKTEDALATDVSHVEEKTTSISTKVEDVKTVLNTTKENLENKTQKIDTSLNNVKSILDTKSELIDRDSKRIDKTNDMFEKKTSKLSDRIEDVSDRIDYMMDNLNRGTPQNVKQTTDVIETINETVGPMLTNVIGTNDLVNDLNDTVDGNLKSIADLVDSISRIEIPSPYDDTNLIDSINGIEIPPTYDDTYLIDMINGIKIPSPYDDTDLITLITTVDDSSKRRDDNLTTIINNTISSLSSTTIELEGSIETTRADLTSLINANTRLVNTLPTINTLYKPPVNNIFSLAGIPEPLDGEVRQILSSLPYNDIYRFIKDSDLEEDYINIISDNTDTGRWVRDKLSNDIRTYFVPESIVPNKNCQTNISAISEYASSNGWIGSLIKYNGTDDDTLTPTCIYIVDVNGEVTNINTLGFQYRDPIYIMYIDIFVSGYGFTRTVNLPDPDARVVKAELCIVDSTGDEIVPIPSYNGNGNNITWLGHYDTVKIISTWQSSGMHKIKGYIYYTIQH